MTIRIKLRRDTAANWTTTNPILAAGEPGLETDTGKIKYGNGVARWNVLEHTGGDALTNVGDITIQTGDADRWFVRLRREDDTTDPQYTGVVVKSTNYDSLGNAIVAAELGLSSGGLVIFKFTPAGELVWKKSVGLLNGTYYIDSNVVIDSDDNIIFAVNPDNNSSRTIVKMDGSTGAIIFSEMIDNSNTLSIKAIAVDSTGNIIIGGSFYWNANIEDTAFVAKLNSTADTITWQKSFSVESRYSFITALEVDFNNDIIVAGYYNYDHTVDGQSVTDNLMTVAKITSAGDVSWKKDITTENFTAGLLTGISLDSLGNIYATGTYYIDNPTDNNDGPGYGGAKSNAIVIFKISTLGVMAWDRRVGPGQCSWVGTSTAVGDDGDLYLYASTYQYKTSGNVDNGDSGYWNATLALARYNKTTGAVIWQSYFDNPLAQEIPAWGDATPWNSNATDLMTVKDDKILIGGSVRFGASDEDYNTPWSPGGDYFNQGFLAQFDTDATRFTAEGWTLETSRIPGKLTNTLIATDSNLILQASGIQLTNEGSEGIEEFAASISVRRTASKINTWTFGKDGTFNAPADANIKLSQKQLGYAIQYGRIDNNEDDIWFESVTHDSDGFAYVLGSDQWGNGSAQLYKFTPEGAKVWACQIHSGSGASFNVEWDSNVYTVATVAAGGSGYKVGDKIVIPGSQLSGVNGVNSLTLEVATINIQDNYIGSVATVDIISGVAVGSNSAASVADYYGDAKCEVRSITFDPVTGNPVVLITTPTYNGDTYDNEWTESVLLLIDSGSGAVISSTTLSDNGDIYARDVAVSVSGKVAVVGQKLGEYTEYGAITPLAGSSTDKLWVTKADIDTTHFPGEANGYIPDWYITGSEITDQVQVQYVNQYIDLTVSVQQGQSATFDVSATTGSTLATITPTDLAGATATGTMVKNADNIVTLGGWGSWLVFPNSALRVTLESLFTMNQVIPVNWDTGSTSLTGFVTIQFPGDGTFQITPVEEGGGAAIAGTWYFDLLLKALGSYSVTVVGGGTNYLAGHKIVVAGTSLGGTSPANDMVITVDAVDTGAITSVSNTGSPVSSGTYTGLTGANYQYGSGVVMEIIFDATTGAFSYIQNISSPGSNYVTGDKLTIAGTLFAGGASPANDIVFTVVDVNAGQVNSLSWVSGSIPSTHLLIRTNAGVEFAAEGETFAIKQSMGSEAFIWTEDFNKTLGGESSDWFDGVVWNAAGTHLYAVGSVRTGVDYDQALVVKFSSSGTIAISKFVNDSMSNDSASKGAVALMANDSIVVVHQQYNPYRDEVDEILVTKLDSDLNIVWQQFIGVQDLDGDWESPQGRISVVVDPASDEILIAWAADEQSGVMIDDDTPHLLKLDTDGEVLWKRIFGIHESDSYVSYTEQGNSKFLSIHGDQFTLVGYTYGSGNNGNYNAFITTLPLDGTGVGLHGFWTYAEPNDDKIKVWRLSDRTSTTVTPTVHTGVITATTNVKYYYAGYQDEQFTLYPQVILSNEGGAIEFADGSKQTFSTALVPQVRIGEGRYIIRPEDSGRHILVEDSSYSITIPNWERVTLPVGFTFTIINISGGTLDVVNEYSNNIQGQMWFSGGNDKTPAVSIADNGSGQMVTLIKIKEGTGSDDGDVNGDIWMIAGADISNND